MGIRSHARLLSALLVVVAMLFSSCSSTTAPSKPQPGTPAFNWLTAQDAFKQGDYVKAQGILTDLALGKSEYAERALPLAAILNHGTTHAYMELAEKYAAGAKKARTNAAVFYRLTGEYRAKAKSSAMRFADVARVLNANLKPDQDVVLALQLPEGPTVDPGQYQKIGAGNAIPPAEVPDVETHVIRHEVMFSALRTLGAGENVEKGRSMYSAGDAHVPGQTFLFALAEGLYETAEILGPKKLNQPSNFRSAMLAQAGTALAKVKESKDTKALAKKIKDAEKSLATS